MKTIILAAGYATRLYPLTQNFPKPLLKVKEKTILDWLIDDIDSSQSVDEYIIISNHKFVEHFIEWSKTKKQKIKILDDGTESNETRLGAVRDIQFAIDALKINDDTLVIAGDNLLNFSMKTFLSYAKNKGASCVMRYYEPSVQKLTKCGVLEIDDKDQIIKMTEKPPQPQSNWCCPPFYYYTKNDLSLIEEGIAAGCGVDAPGSFIAWLCTKSPVFAMEMPGKRFDIGNLESYSKVQSEYEGPNSRK